MTIQSRITAVLGPTNTGKTHYAIERMLGYRSGIIGLPLRLLAREVYDRIVAIRGPSVVALVTGEERIVPERTQYWVCTVEAMPQGMGTDFLAIDEIQLCADPERGHVFTDRLLNARGTHETLFMGAETMRSAIAALVPKVQFMKRERFSELSYAGPRKISRMPARSAIVGFSVENVYAIAEVLRRQKGGAAVVMGALSPRTRNAQVEMYQNGDVDYLVATDAIGMGLNLDINHVAFSSLSKFDGRRMRPLSSGELAQVAGRAGRHMQHGTFGVTGEAPEIGEETVEAITNHSFPPVKKLFWRNSRLEFGSIDRLIRSLEQKTDHEWLSRVRESDDLGALKTLAEDPEVRSRATDGRSVRLLWDVCRIPDFRGISHAEHASLLTQIFVFLHDQGRVPDDWMARQVKRIDRTDGEIDTISKRLAYIRTWTYVAQRKGWVRDESHWRSETRAVEDRLSDALHGALTQRFVDRRTSVLLRRLKQKEGLVAEVNDKGEVSVGGEYVGRLEGFRFRQDKTGSPDEAKTVRSASIQALAPEFNLRADRFYNAPDPEIDFTEQGGLMWGDQAVGKLVAGSDPLKPQVVAFVDEEAGEEVAQKVQRRLQHFIDRRIAAAFEPLLKMRDDEALTGLAKGFAFRMVENFGIIPRGDVAEEVRGLDQEARGSLRKHGVRFGQFTIFMPLLLKPAPTRLRLVLWSLDKGLDTFPEAPPPGLVTVPADRDAVPGVYAMSGYRAAGDRAIRIDMLERLADMLREQDTRNGFEATADMLSITGMTLEQFAGLMEGLGYKAEKGERQKQRASVPADPPAEPPVEPPAPDTPPETPPVPDPDTPPQPDVPPETPPEPDTPDTPPAPPQPDVPPAPGPDETPPDRPDETPVEEPGEVPPAPPNEVPGDLPPQEMPPGPDETPTMAAGDSAAPEGEAETEVFYTFTWGGRRGGQRPAKKGQRRGKPQEGGQRKGGKPRGKGRDSGPKEYTSGPARGKGKDKKIDPDNPFAAALAGLKKD